MSMSLLQSAVLFFVGIHIINIQSTSAWSGNVCRRSTTEIVTERYCIYTSWQACCAWGYRRKCVYRTTKCCCSGWTHSGDQNCNQPVCRSCQYGGTCIAPNRCKCPSGRIGNLCQGRSCVSHLQPCYPGSCSNERCRCADKFIGATCLTFDSDNYKPTIDGSRVIMTNYDRSKSMMMYQYSADASRGTQKVDIWSNQNGFNMFNFTFDVDFDYIAIRDSVIPYQPPYVKTFRLGVVEASVTWTLNKLRIKRQGNQNSNLTETHRCVGFSKDNPVNNTVQSCVIYKDTFPYRLNSGDKLKFTFMAKSGGVRQLVSPDVTDNVLDTSYYTGKAEQTEMEFFFDFNVPSHCSEQSTCANNDHAFNVVEEFTKNPINTRWSGWSDDLYGGGVARYAWEIFKLAPEKYSKQLEEPEPLEPVHITELNHTGSGQYQYTYTPTEPGMYSMILEINDKANNSRYVRRLVLYDPSSEITLDPDDKLYASSAFKDTGYSWQSNNAPDGTAQVTLQWLNHFANKFHEQNYLLKEVREYPEQLDDGGRRGKGYKKIEKGFDDNEGARQISEIKNHHGIVQFEIVHQVDTNGGRDLLTPPLPGWSSVTSLFENGTISLENLADGKTAKIWVRATDVMGNTKVDSTIVHFDSSTPEILKTPEIENNIENSEFPFASRIKVFGRDKDSGLFKIHWKLIMAQNGTVKMEADAFNKKRSDSECQITPCYTVPMGDRYFNEFTFDINHCWMRVPKGQQESLVMHLQLDFQNSALLKNTTSLTISNIPQLDGIGDYYPPQNIKVTKSLLTGVTLTWDHAPSCYERIVILIIVVMPDGSTKTLRADKDAKRFDIVGLEPETGYNIRLITVYDLGLGQTVQSNEQPYQLRTADEEAIHGGYIGMIVIIIVLFAMMLVLFAFLWRRRRKKHRDNIDNLENNFVTFSNNTRKENDYGPRVMSASQARDSIYYGQFDLKESFRIAREKVALEQEIKRGKFAIIYKAYWYSDREPETVVAKVLKEDATDNDRELMKAKINFYNTEVGENVNVLKFLGAVEDEQLGDFMLLEYCECGTLRDYLTTNRKRVTEDVQDKLYRFSLDVCRGMNYLAGRKIVHRKLAARNLLLTFTHCVKIYGFGPMPNEQVAEENKESLPIKFMAPECIEAKSTRNATTKSDVWAYGIVLWEIFSMGDKPFPKVSGSELLTYLKRGERMKKPEYSDTPMYDMMKSCWEFKPNKRPCFTKLTTDLDALFVTSGDDTYYDSKNIYKH